MEAGVASVSNETLVSLRRLHAHDAAALASNGGTPGRVAKDER
jgi:hypothetical protein